MTQRIRRLAFILAGAVVLVTACVTNAKRARPGVPPPPVPTRPARLLEVASSGVHVKVDLDEWSISPDSMKVPAGAVTFAVRNHGLIPHELSVFGTDEESGDIPVVKGRAAVKSLVAAATTAAVPVAGSRSGR